LPGLVFDIGDFSKLGCVERTAFVRHAREAGPSRSSRFV